MRIWFFDLFLSFMHHYSCACVYRCRSMEAGRYHQLLFSLSVVEQCSKSRNVINREVLDDSNSRARSEYNWLVVDRKMMEWVRQLGWWNSQDMESHQNHQPEKVEKNPRTNHQPTRLVEQPSVIPTSWGATPSSGGFTGVSGGSFKVPYRFLLEMG